WDHLRDGAVPVTGARAYGYWQHLAGTSGVGHDGRVSTRGTPRRTGRAVAPSLDVGEPGIGGAIGWATDLNSATRPRTDAAEPGHAAAADGAVAGRSDRAEPWADRAGSVESGRAGLNGATRERVDGDAPLVRH